MEDTKLEKLHKDLKTSAQSRGGRGGLGKGTDGSKRLKIDAEGGSRAASSHTKEVPSSASADPKHIYIKFVRASEGTAKPNEPATEQGRNQNLVSFESDDDEPVATKKKTKSKKKTGVKAYRIEKVDEEADIDDCLKSGSKVLNGVGQFAKATVVKADGTKTKIKNAVVHRIHGELHALNVELSDETSSMIVGTLKKYTIGSNGLQLLASIE